MASKRKTPPKKSEATSKSLTKYIAKHNLNCNDSCDARNSSDNSTDALVGCDDILSSKRPESLFRFRRPFFLDEIQLTNFEPGDPDGALSFSNCLSLNWSDLTAIHALDLEYEQAWYFQKIERARVEKVISVGPNETVQLSIKTSQRKFFSRTTVEETESSESTESTITDREAMNATRNSTRTKNWQVSGNASISIPIPGASIGFGGNASFSKSLSRTIASTVEQVNETTTKSAENLRSLHKIDVVESEEYSTTSEHSRKITNPYHDRAISVKAIGLNKEFCVDFSLMTARPTFIVEVQKVNFTKDFVVAHADFIEQHLLDERLKVDFFEILETVQNPQLESALDRSNTIARMALEYLFDKPNIFGVEPIVFSPQDPNLPASSFDAGLVRNGLDDAAEKGFFRVFSTLNFYYRIYKDEAPHSDSTAIELCLSLEDALTPMWLAIEEDGTFADVVDQKDHTEVLRRLSGFLVYIKGSLKPLVTPSEAERENNLILKRAEFVINRLIDHLNCHDVHYLNRYLEHIHKMTNGTTLQKLVQTIVQSNTVSIGTIGQFVDAFAIEELFVSGNSIIVPGRCTYTEDMVNDLLTASGYQASDDIKYGTLCTEKVTTPCEGYHLETIEGKCILSNVPVPDSSPEVSVSFSDKPVPVSVTNP